MVYLITVSVYSFKKGQTFHRHPFSMERRRKAPRPSRDLRAKKKKKRKKEKLPCKNSNGNANGRNKREMNVASGVSRRQHQSLTWEKDRAWVQSDYALRESKCSQQLQAMAYPSADDVALPSSSTTIRLLFPSMEKKIFICINSASKDGGQTGLETWEPHLKWHLGETFCRRKAVSFISVMNCWSRRLTRSYLSIRVMPCD